MPKNYNKYFKGEKPVNPVDVDEITNLAEPNEDASGSAKVEPAEAAAEAIYPEVAEVPKTFYRINNCNKLNVRTEPNKDGALLCVLDPTSSFEIEELKSNPEWVKVFLDNGEVGFCMKMYVAIQ